LETALLKDAAEYTSRYSHRQSICGKNCNPAGRNNPRSPKGKSVIVELVKSYKPQPNSPDGGKKSAQSWWLIDKVQPDFRVCCIPFGRAQDWLIPFR
jgi:hypothetical protein